jgi:HEPN domain-containing protein
MNKDIKYWLDLALYDKGTADAMYKTGRYLYVLFMCQQCLEKALKGFVVKKTNKFPPRIHDLSRLADLCKLGLNRSQKELLHALSAYYIETRYPGDIRKMTREIDRDKARQYLKATKEMFAWLKARLV